MPCEFDCNKNLVPPWKGSSASLLQTREARIEFKLQQIMTEIGIDSLRNLITHFAKNTYRTKDADVTVIVS